ncbi:MAG: oxygen-independent coproporphyrinogen III oxidase [Bacillota bacterium]|nr:MAG: oxygen-independent coproporphyrinogen III oxidase [Bacillota bacterium]
MLALYVHVPFCRSKCAYCDFFSLPISSQTDAYAEALIREVNFKGSSWGGKLNTFYFGGGTPSCLEPELLAAVLNECGRFFSWDCNTEFTVEVNPGTVNRRYLEYIRSLGVNRLSIGLQAAQDSHLRRLGRGHSVAEFSRALEDARSAGFVNVSIDAIYGLPEQTCVDYMETLDFVVSSGAEHVSVYALQVESNTPFYERWSQGKLIVPDDDAVAEMMLKGRDFLLKQGYSQYEISNFALPGFESRHNMTYWRNQEYLGLGPSAASYIGGRRFVNIADLSAYTNTLAAGKLPLASCECLDQERSMAETVILGLRMLNEGVNRQTFKKRYGVDPLRHYQQIIDKWCNLGFLEFTPDLIRLTAKAVPVASQIQLTFLP